MPEAHTSSEFDALLDRARLLLSQMGARVERQVGDAIECLSSGSALLIDQVIYAVRGDNVRHTAPFQSQ